MEKIHGIGTDLLEIERICRLTDDKQTGSLFLSRTYTEEEQMDIRNSDHVKEAYATHFAAKEAVFKAFGISSNYRFFWRDIEILHKGNGQMEVHLLDKMKEKAEELHICYAHISASYDGGFASAFAVLTAEEN